MMLAISSAKERDFENFAEGDLLERYDSRHLEFWPWCCREWGWNGVMGFAFNPQELRYVGSGRTIAQRMICRREWSSDNDCEG